MNEELYAERLGNILKAIENLNEKVDTIDKFIRGNGKVGINVRLIKLEETSKRHIKFIWLIVGGVVALFFGFLKVVLTKYI